ncbi:bifunctional homocysteine S-methyltransferase/methylenetetrahydrofolate reductase [Dictyobacter arantiisoli]|uniref:Bifunctional homocysteine S-methyltransferase/methylenetetrahydrofolate reductase n=1 Tax=Dictyobacter arantiisoli TaxID=2014874 RepID=A0A5A5THW5_9CHLR|nr:bifunctional homocysteine S-methyltransferase/methylenetetrahydrofolate reductase [Dictyobacter arantiisoli]GCF10967.1 bifunctional homocysteine S-methyltransferase/methylenetetrahydrofolate reductase [Dictyobacter arantiisoli]
MQTHYPFLERLRHGPLLCDGGMGTELYARGISYERCFEHLNLTNPELIKSVHLDYVAAGAQIIETNTFGANRYRLAEHGLEDQVYEINRAGAKIAREVRDLSEQPIFLAGNIGPLGSPLAPIGKIQPDEAQTAFLEQTEALLQSGVDLLIIETMSDLTEMSEALTAVRSLTDLPVVALMTFGEDGTVTSGEDAPTVARTLRDLGANVVGVNCAMGPASMFDVAQDMCAYTSEDFFIGVQPNAGLPRRVGNRFIYVSTPEYFADYTRRFLKAGIRMIGGCCGTTPRHISAMHDVLTELAPTTTITTDLIPASTPTLEALRERIQETATAGTPAQPAPTHVAQLLQDGKFVISIEMSPPRSVKFTRFLQNAILIRDSGADAINITDNAMARVRMNNVAAARLIQQNVGIETIVHFTPRDRNLMAVQSDVIGAHATEIRNILAITGDPPSHGDFPNSTGIWDVDSIGLISILHNLNLGLDGNRRKLAAASSFFIGCAANPVAPDLDVEMERLHRKIENGARYIMTQPVFAAETFLSYKQNYENRYGQIPIPILIGLQPLHSYQQAEKFHNEVPGIVIPTEIRNRMREAGDTGSTVGLDIIKELFDNLAPAVQGAYIMPLDRYELITELIPYIRQRTQSPYART